MTTKIYGIDLGTTNSLIGYGDKLYTGLVPSIAKVKEGISGAMLKYNFDEDTSRSFKINMSMGDEGKESIAASSLVLKELVRQVPEEVKDVVISVPAYFTDNERKATVKAATLLNLNVRSLINEPTAAALYYNKSNVCLSVVFDLGGGTFDISVIDSRLDFNDVVSTDGCVLGGDNFDNNILSYVLKYSKIKLYKTSKNIAPIIKSKCEEAKILIQQTGKEAVIDLTEFSDLIAIPDKKIVITLDVYKQIMKATFKNCLILTKRIITKAVSEGDNYSFIFVGGSTRCPYLREWIEEELDIKAVPISYNQDTIVAQGAAYFANLIEEGKASSAVVDVIKALGIEETGGFIKNIIPNDTKLPVEKTIFASNSIDGSGVFIKLYQGESIRVENAYNIGTLNYEFSEPKKALMGTIRVKLRVDMSGVITLSAKEPGREEVSLQLKV